MLESVPGRTSQWRRRRASLLSSSFRAGDSAAAKSLFLRSAALKGIAMHGWIARLAKANAAYRAAIECRNRERALDAMKKRELEPFLMSSRDPSS